MGSLGDYLKNQNPRLTGNNQYEDMEKRFTMNDVPSGEELFDAIKCNIHGLVKGYYRVSRVNVIGYIYFFQMDFSGFLTGILW